jgi:hypothetical protein
VERFFLNLYLAIFYACTTKDVRFVAIGQYLRALCNNLPFRLYLPFYWRNFPETSYLAPYLQALQSLWLRLWPAVNLWNFIWNTCAFSSVCRLHYRDFLGTLYITPYSQALQTLSLGRQSVTNWGQFTWRMKYVLHWWDFPEISSSAPFVHTQK